MPKDFKEMPGYREITDDDVRNGFIPGPLNASNQREWLIVSMLRKGFQDAVQPLIDAIPADEQTKFWEWYKSLKDEDIPEGWK